LSGARALLVAGSLAAALLLHARPGLADFETGRRAYQAGDYAVAIAEWSPLAEAGDPDAAFGLGLIYDKGRGVAQDRAKAAHWYRRAAEQGHPGAAFNLGNLYRAGQGVPADATAAVTWWTRAAEQGLPQAQLNLGVAYQLGEGVMKDEAQAFRWYRRAAEAGDPVGQYYLGLAYEQGVGVGPDPTAALGWYRRAAAQGEPRAADRLAGIGSDVPAGTATASSAPPAPGAGYGLARPGAFVQLAAYLTPERAERAWAEVAARHAELLAALPHLVVAAHVGEDSRLVYRLRVGPLADAEAAKALCGALKERGTDCFSVAP
jgi:TPR repeat protein